MTVFVYSSNPSCRALKTTTSSAPTVGLCFAEWCARPGVETQTGKANFTVHEIPKIELADNQFLMATVRSHDQYNTTIYGNDDRYRGIYGKRRVVMMSPDDIEASGFVEGQRVDLTSHFEDTERHAPDFVVMQQSLPRRCVVTYFPEANPLVPSKSVALKSNTPTSKSVVVTIRPHRPAAGTG